MENKTSKYFKYAIGEIVLVVLGILIALQINNWNEQRKDYKKEILVMSNLIQDLRSDSLSYAQNLKTLQEINTLHQELYRIGVEGEGGIEIGNPNNIRRLPYHNPITKENDPEVANKISNNSIRKEIQTYFRFAKDMDDVYGEFEAVIQDRMRPYLTQQNAHDLSAWFKVKNVESVSLIGKEKLVELSQYPYFQQLLFEASIKNTDVTNTLNDLIISNAKLIKILENNLYK
ncbi:DUF6090 family protein [Geojedonia litorea]|uniref:DUF6090 family protein n=1 Tax=Geojedonia litorea TaxID=1268269 RepID=A0ABV9N0B3_9FLAO